MITLDIYNPNQIPKYISDIESKTLTCLIYFLFGFILSSYRITNNSDPYQYEIKIGQMICVFFSSLQLFQLSSMSQIQIISSQKDNNKIFHCFSSLQNLIIFVFQLNIVQELQQILIIMNSLKDYSQLEITVAQIVYTCQMNMFSSIQIRFQFLILQEIELLIQTQIFWNALNLGFIVQVHLCFIAQIIQTIIFQYLLKKKMRENHERIESSYKINHDMRNQVQSLDDLILTQHEKVSNKITQQDSQITSDLEINDYVEMKNTIKFLKYYITFLYHSDLIQKNQQILKTENIDFNELIENISDLIIIVFKNKKITFDLQQKSFQQNINLDSTILNQLIVEILKIYYENKIENTKFEIYHCKDQNISESGKLYISIKSNTEKTINQWDLSQKNVISKLLGNISHQIIYQINEIENTTIIKITDINQIKNSKTSSLKDLNESNTIQQIYIENGSKQIQKFEGKLDLESLLNFSNKSTLKSSLIDQSKKEIQNSDVINSNSQIPNFFDNQSQQIKSQNIQEVKKENMIVKPINIIYDDEIEFKKENMLVKPINIISQDGQEFEVCNNTIYINIDDEENILKMNFRMFKKRNIKLTQCINISNQLKCINQISIEQPSNPPNIIAIFDNILDREYGYEGIHLSNECNKSLNLNIKYIVLTSTEDSETKQIYEGLVQMQLVKPLSVKKVEDILFKFNKKNVEEI